ncbi:hypothetical protein tloyanaT_27540 [Thalassotalea loyana]|uniref:DNA-directed DNA polymerase n=1 Tax=Thalassotalea loyana TaxID=280483 RepID=A0ABQ6HEF9_9GAMM|nr:hypothetical protein [Thalassotalea loyana]GLX86501.1 hypothetical protein tloyanaT_27540 [Thalassotalea loyana]
MNWLVEHQKQLSHQLNQGRLPHALLLNGVRQSGKSQLAKWLTGVISCLSPEPQNDKLMPCGKCKHCLLIDSDTYPDIYELQAEGDTHKVDEVRVVTQYLQKTPQLGAKQVVIIHAADKMNVSASNALLKTLEEPSASSILLLLTDKKHQLLETIISRCQTIDIKPYVGGQLADLYQLNDNDPYLNLTHLPQLTSEEIAQDYREIEGHILAFFCGTYSPMMLAQELTQSEYGLNFLYQVIAKLIRQESGWYADELHAQYQGVKSKVTTTSLLQVNTLLLSLLALCQQVQTNKQLQTEKFLISVQQLLNNK